MDRTPKLKFSSPDRNLDCMVASAVSKSSLGLTSMLSFGAAGRVKRPGNLIYQSFDQDEIGDEYLDEYFNQQEKKKRLSVDQVQLLERSFEADNKLEPERKIQLAKELGVQARQVAVWFQNRRARWKARQLETDYETLLANYKNLEIDYDNLLKENEKLKAEVFHLKCNGIARDTEKANSQLHNTKELPEAMPKAIASMISEDEESQVSALIFKNEEQSSVKSDVTNLDSPRLTDGIHSSVLESGDSSHVLGADQSYSSRNGEDDLIEELLLPDYILPKVGDARWNAPVSSFYCGFPVDSHAFSFW